MRIILDLSVPRNMTDALHFNPIQGIIISKLTKILPKMNKQTNNVTIIARKTRLSNKY